MREMVCAVVVTYNRKELLIECLESLKEQSRTLDAIFIIDNSSTDGTPEILLKNRYIDYIPPMDLLKPHELTSNMNQIPIHYVRMHKNIGGAGGFHEGLKRAYEQGYDWFWLMDDDGIPSQTCLETQLTKKQFPIIGPLIMNNENQAELAIQGSVYKNGKNVDILTVDDAYKVSDDKIITGYAVFFSGLLIRKDVVEKIGYPRKEFFIWGDEAEYSLRAFSNNFNAVTVLDAHYFHPPNRVTLKYPLKGLIGHSIITNDLKSYCYHRNYFHIKKNYFGYKMTLLWITSETTRRIFLNDLKGLKIVLKAWKDALLNKWGKEKQFIK
ncbi:glycosyltransferase family 2 protein [Methanobacterium sp. ACI-7]|uniref:glycosyltransferase family 2 protein n=1 Tax=unclassified Methanobacterium TaxID=2627676 RepID=UPI0039C26AE5